MNFYLSFLNLIDAIVQPLIKLCKIAVISCVLSIALIVSASIFFRYVLNDSITWSEEIAKYLMVWMVFVGAPVAMIESVRAVVHENETPEKGTKMSALILDGKALSLESEADLTQRVAAIKEQNNGQAPILATILVGADPASATYVKMKQNACKRIGMESIAVEMPSTTSTRELLAKIDELNINPNCHGILLQHPVHLVPEVFDRLSELHICVGGELNLRGEHTDSLSLIDSYRVLWHLVLHKSHRREVSVDDRSQLSQIKRLDDVT
mgnify:CR=1 FL=1